MNVCDLIEAETVAEAMGGASAGAPEDYDPGFGGKGCRYSARAAGGTRYAEVGLLPPGEYESRLRMRSGEYHDLGGLGDGAWWKHRVDRTEVNILRRGEVALWIRFQEHAVATREEEARRLGGAVLAQLR